MTKWYVDPVNGASGNTGLGFWSCSYTNGNGTQPPVDESQTMTGGSSGKTAKLVAITVTSGTWAGHNAAGVLFFMSKSGTFTASETGTFNNGATCTITADLAIAGKKLPNDVTFVAGDEVRMAKSPDPVSIGNAEWTDGGDIVTLSTPLTATIDQCEAVSSSPGNNQWKSGITNVSCSATNNYRKSGTNAINLIVASGFTTGLIGWCKIPSEDFSAYSGFCFWFRANAAVNANILKFSLFSGADGTGTEIESYTLDYKLEANQYYPIVYRKGSSFSSTPAQSFAITALSDPGSVTLYIDTISACNNFHLRSLISKYTSGTNECWYGLDGIDEATLTLGGTSNKYGLSYMKYVADSADASQETVETFMRECLEVTTLATSSSTVILSYSTYGTPSAYVQISGGWNSVTGSQDGLTFFDGINSWGQGLCGVSYGQYYMSAKKIGLVRYYYGFGGRSETQIILEDVYFITAGASISVYNLIGKRIYQCGYQPTVNGLCYIEDSKFYNINTGSAFGAGGGRVFVKNSDFSPCENNSYGVIASSGSYAQVFLFNCRYSHPSSFLQVINGSSNAERVGIVVSVNGNGVAGASRMSVCYCRGIGNYYQYYIDKDTTLYRGASGASLRITPMTASVKAESSCLDEGMEVAVASSGDFTINCYVRKSHTSAGDGATYNGNAPRIICRKNWGMSLSEDTVIATHPGGESAGDWVQLSGSLSAAGITPPMDGVYEFVVDCDGTTGFINIDDWSVS